MMGRYTSAVCLLFVLVTSLQAAPPKKPPPKKVVAKAPVKKVEAPPKLSKEGVDFFEAKIRPVLIRSCYRCHSGDPGKAKGGFALDNRAAMLKGGTSGEVLSPGHPEKSLLIEAIKYEGLEMPPDGRLSEDVVADFEEWVRMGAPDPRFGKAGNPKNKIDWNAARSHWAFQRPKPPEPPTVKDAAWPRTTIDKYVLARMEREQLKPVADADKQTLLRRVTFDLTGLPPTPEEIAAFEKDTSANAFVNVVDRLLDSPRFGERWGRHWLDVVRYAESTGRERNVPYRYAWRYRNYVIDAFNADKPYNRFIVEQLAGDLLKTKSTAEHEQLVIATGLLAIGPKAINTKNVEQFQVDLVDDQIDVTGRAFLGLTIACARCHDHKFDPIPTTDYYAIAGIFHSTKTFAGATAGRKTANERQLITVATQPVGKEAAAETDEQKTTREEIAKVEAKLKTLRQQLKQSQKKPAQAPQMQAKKNGKGKSKGKPMVKPIAANTSTSKAPAANTKSLREEIKKLENRLEDLESEPTPIGPLAMGVHDVDAPKDYHVLVRGELKEKGPDVPRGMLTIMKSQFSQINPKHSGRLELANWIADKSNPLTARVLVNRVWSHLFDRGLVDSVDNFGALGNEPTHPELLDALAVAFMDDKWSVKRLIRGIVLSRTYQLGNDYDETNYEKDPDNTSLWRMTARRLDAEEIRDAVLLASGQLDVARPEASPVINLSTRQVGSDRGMQELRKPTNARSVYLPMLRGAVPEMLGAFDVADPNLIVGKRDVTTVPTQALFLMNNPFILKQAEETAKRVLAEPKLEDHERINLAFRLSLGREADDDEQAELTKYLSDYRTAIEAASEKGKVNSKLAAWASLCQLLFETGEFRYRY